jgi:uncharacterized membrane protein
LALWFIRIHPGSFRGHLRFFSSGFPPFPHESEVLLRLTDTIDIDAPPELVWSVWRDVERWPDWTASITSVDLLDAGPLRVGVRARIRQPKLPIAVWRVMSVTEPGTSDNIGFSWVSTSPGSRVTGDHRIVANGSASRAHLSVDFEGPLAIVVAFLTRRLTQRYLQLEATGLKKRSEERASR